MLSSTTATANKPVASIKQLAIMPKNNIVAECIDRADRGFKFG
ncbi:MAG: hypothetical protein ACK521_06455 [bacterium]|jgi:hypothetical protein